MSGTIPKIHKRKANAVWALVSTTLSIVLDSDQSQNEQGSICQVSMFICTVLFLESIEMPSERFHNFTQYCNGLRLDVSFNIVLPSTKANNSWPSGCLYINYSPYRYSIGHCPSFDQYLQHQSESASMVHKKLYTCSRRF